MGKLLKLLTDSGRLLLDGGPGFCLFAVNNWCNATCAFCNFANVDPRQGKNVNLAEACEAIDILYERGVRYIDFFGGEPLLHPDLTAMVGHASQRGMTPMVITNGAPLTPKRIEALRQNGLLTVYISLDAASADLHDKNRGIPRLTERIREAIPRLRAAGIEPIASVTINRLISSYADVVDFIEALGFRRMNFSYPLTAMHSSYLGFSDSELVQYRDDELLAIFEEIRRLKARFPILNPTEGLEEMIRFVRKAPPKFPCLAGYKYFYLDWTLTVYRCEFLKESFGTIQEFRNAPLIRDGCNLCMIDCFRDSSVMQAAAVAFGDAVRGAGRGRLPTAARTLLNRNNYLSLRAALEQVRELYRGDR